MNWRDVGRAIKGVAPLLGRAVERYVPGGDIAVNIIEDLASAFGAKPEPDDLAEKIAATGDPELAIKAREVEFRHAEELVRLDQQTDAMYLADREAARQREREGVRVTGKRDWFQYALASAVLAMTFTIAIMLMFVVIPAGNVSTINVVFGVLISGTTMVLGYYFGSSAGSAAKTRLLASGRNSEAA